MITEESELHGPYLLLTPALTQEERAFLLTRHCAILEAECTALIFCPFGTMREYMQGEGEETDAGKGRLFLLTFPDGFTCQEWYFPSGESHLILPDGVKKHLNSPSALIDSSPFL